MTSSISNNSNSESKNKNHQSSTNNYLAVIHRNYYNNVVIVQSLLIIPFYCFNYGYLKSIERLKPTTSTNHHLVEFDCTIRATRLQAAIHLRIEPISISYSGCCKSYKCIHIKDIVRSNCDNWFESTRLSWIGQGVKRVRLTRAWSHYAFKRFSIGSMSMRQILPTYLK